MFVYYYRYVCIFLDILQGSVETHLRCGGIYTVFRKKDPFCFFIIHSNDDQFTQNF